MIPSLPRRHFLQLERAGCVISNLKVNIPDLRFDSDDAAMRRHTLEEYKPWIDAAALLGARWLRPFPGRTAFREEFFSRKKA